MQALSVRVLGDFGIDGIDQRAFGSRKARRLVELLALGRGRVVPFDVLQQELWGDRPPARPLDQLAVLVSRMRTLLGPEHVARRDGGYLLRYDRLDIDDIDALTADVQLRTGAGDRAGALVAARALLVLLSAGTPGSGDSVWVDGQVADVDRLLTRARHAVASALLNDERWSDAADVAASALHRDPYDEVAARAQMTALARADRIGSALVAYQALRERLADELGTDPSPQTRDLYAAILRGEIRPAPLRPRPVTDAVVGRDAEQASLDAVGDLAGPTAQVVVVEGEAGIGKTTLLRHFAAHRAAAGDVVLAAACRPLDRAVPLDAVLVALADHLRLIGDDAAGLLGAETKTLGPLLGLTPPRSDRPLLSDGAPGPSVLFAMLFAILARIASRSRVVLLIDDAHLGGELLSTWVDYLGRRSIRMLVVAAVRPGEGEPFRGFRRVELGALDFSAVAAIVGQDRAAELYQRSQGHPLLLAELAAGDSDGVPSSLVEAVSGHCEALGDGSATLRAAAILGPHVDPELLSGVLRRPVMSVLDDLDNARARRLVVESNGRYTFRHELVREALVAGASSARSRVLHVEAGRILAQRPGVDPIEVAEHARLGGDGMLAAHWLRAAAAKAGRRFDHSTAESLLGEALMLHDEPGTRLERARVRTLRGHYDDALDDVVASRDVSPPALEVRAWASYFARHFDAARDCADEGAATADESVLRARCLMVGGRTRHAAGDLGTADRQLTEALEMVSGSDRVAAAAWLGVLRSHQSRVGEALALLRPALRPDVDVSHTAAGLHAVLFSGHAHALAGRPTAALACFRRYTAEVERRQVPRFAGRGINFGGWVHRNLGNIGPGVEAHLAALEVADLHGTPEVRIAALLDLAENAVVHGDIGAAGTRLDEATAALHGDLVFGWRLDFKLQLIGGRLALLAGDPGSALEKSAALAATADRLGVPRYSSVARLVGHLARAGLGLPVDPARVEADLDLADNSVAIESWWWAGDLGATLGVYRWIDRAEAGAARILSESGSSATGFDTYARRRIDAWRDR